MGFGTGLNAFLTLISATKYDIDIDYEAFETDPLGPHIYQELPYYQLVPGSTLLDYTQIHDSDWAVPIAISSNFNLLKRNEDILQAAIASSKFDIIYYDAFAPSCQEQLWDSQLHEKLYDSLKPNGCLVTYCSQGAFRRTLQSIGYQIEKLNGPGKKREMLRAIKI